MNERDFRIAFSFEGYLDEVLKVDPRYVKWIFRIWGAKNNEKYERILPYHKCTPEDYAEFYPI